MKKLLLILTFAPAFLLAQSKKQRRAIAEQQKADQAIINNLKNHVQFLTGDKLEGRSTGSQGEALAMEYISNQFKNIGLQPKGTNGYIQEFLVDEGKQIDPSTSLNIDGNKLELKKDYVPLAYSATKSVSGTPAMALKERGVPWFVDVKEWLDANANNASFNINNAIQKEAARAAAKGATALFLYNSSNRQDNIRFDNKDKTPASPIPVIYIMPDGYKKYFSDHSQVLDIELNVALREGTRKGHNVIGYVDNGAPAVIVIGAHYDHSGMDEDANASDTGKAIRRGADDNASGTAALIELARMLAASKAKSNNYIFIAFSGKEIGMLGSKYWLDNPTVNLPVNYMINLDMIGRYNADKKLSVAGYASSPIWPQVIAGISDKTLQVKLDSTNAGPGDHETFYRKNIPVLFFNTGISSDYHKAADVADKPDYEGELRIAKYITRLVETTDNKGRIAFAKKEIVTAAPTESTVNPQVKIDNTFNLALK
jgi:aminopeptidase YwaD